MTLKFPPESFFETSGNVAAQFSESVRDSIVDFACDLWSNYPAYISNNKSPAASFSRGFMNSICQGRVTLPTLDPIPFSGGQCPGVLYDFTYVRGAYNISSCVLSESGPFTLQFVGPLGRPFHNPTGVTATTSCNGLSNATVELGNWLISTGAGDANLLSSAFNDPTGTADPPLSYINVLSVVRADGLPDNCGDLESGYDSPMPTGQDLTTNITVNVADNQDLTFNVTYNQLSPEFNFPIGFKMNGVNITLDMSGLTIYGDKTYERPGNNNDPAPPGNDGGDNGVDPPYDTEFPEFSYPVLPEFSLPEVVSETFDTAICDEGTITIIQEIVKTIPGISPPIRLLLEILVAILTELCEFEGGDAIVGFPEYYGVKPGAGRPAIVYLYKTWDGTNYGASTYSSTVNQPSQAAIDEIPTVVVPNKTIGTFVSSITMLGGTRLRASGDTKASSLVNVNYLISKADSSIVPPNVQDQIVTTEDTRLNVTALVCRQIEYYPNGAGASKTASIKRVIDQP